MSVCPVSPDSEANSGPAFSRMKAKTWKSIMSINVNKQAVNAGCSPHYFKWNCRCLWLLDETQPAFCELADVSPIYFLIFPTNPMIFFNQVNHTLTHKQPHCMFNDDRSLYQVQCVIKHLCTIETGCLLGTFMGVIQVKLINPTFDHIHPKETQHSLHNTPSILTL